MYRRMLIHSTYTWLVPASQERYPRQLGGVATSRIFGNSLHTQQLRLKDVHTCAFRVRLGSLLFALAGFHVRDSTLI